MVESWESHVIQPGALSLLLFPKVQVPKYIHVLGPNLSYNYSYPNPKYLVIGYMDYRTIGFKLGNAPAWFK